MSHHSGSGCSKDCRMWYLAVADQIRYEWNCWTCDWYRRWRFGIVQLGLSNNVSIVQRVCLKVVWVVCLWALRLRANTALVQLVRGVERSMIPWAALNFEYISLDRIQLAGSWPLLSEGHEVHMFEPGYGYEAERSFVELTRDLSKSRTFQIFMQYWQVVMHNIVQQNFKTTGLMTFAVFMSFYVKEYGHDEDLATEDETEYTKMLCCESDEEQETCEDILYTFHLNAKEISMVGKKRPPCTELWTLTPIWKTSLRAPVMCLKRFCLNKLRYFRSNLS